MIKTIPLTQLRSSPRNVRRSTDPDADARLKADIAARGLLQNLVVSPARARGTFQVEAGGRRLAALASLLEDGVIASDHGVPCLVIGKNPDRAREASLAENFQRLAMNPADECLAFGQLVEAGSDLATIARRFGVTQRFVEGRLRLAELAPCVFEALGADEISLEVAKAYAATPDRERQAWVFGEMHGSYCAGNPDSIRRMMTHATASATDRRAIFVGPDDYVAAGGRIEADLFADGAAERWLDVPLLETLAARKLEDVAGQCKAELGIDWVRSTLEPWIGCSLTEGLVRFVPEREPLSGEEEARIDEAEKEIDELVGVLEDEGREEQARTEAEIRIRALDAEIAALRDKPPVLDASLKATLGTFLLLSDTGSPVLDRAFYVAAPDGSREPSRQSTPGDREPAGESGRPKPLSRSLCDELAIQRRDVLAANVAAAPGLALDLAVFLMVDRPLSASADRSGSTLAAPAPSDPVAGYRTPDARATKALEQGAQALERSWTQKGSRAERFDAFRAMDETARSAWLCHAIARSLEASCGGQAERPCRFHDHLGALLAIDVHAWWRPTGRNFFDRVSKAVILQALETVGGTAFASRYSGLRKAELAQAAELLFRGEGVADADILERASTWVPEPMRFVIGTGFDPAGGPAPWEQTGERSPEDPSEDEPVEPEASPDPAPGPLEDSVPLDAAA